MPRALESEFRDLEGFSDRHSARELAQVAAAIALGRKDIDGYLALREDIRRREG